MMDKKVKIKEIRDLGSRNGTFLNGTRIGEVTVLRPGDRVRLGSSEANDVVDSLAAPVVCRPERQPATVTIMPVGTPVRSVA